MDPGGEFAIRQQLVDQRGQHLLSGHAGETEAIGGISLPDVEGTVLGRREIDGASRFPAACLADGDAFGRRSGARERGWAALPGVRDRSASASKRSAAALIDANLPSADGTLVSRVGESAYQYDPVAEVSDPKCRRINARYYRCCRCESVTAALGIIIY